MPIIIADGPVSNPYADASDLIGRLPNLCQAARTVRGLTVTQAAGQIGISATTLTGFEAGTSNYTKSTLLAVLGWLAAF